MDFPTTRELELEVLLREKDAQLAEVTVSIRTHNLATHRPHFIFRNSSRTTTAPCSSTSRSSPAHRRATPSLYRPRSSPCCCPASRAPPLLLASTQVQARARARARSLPRSPSARACCRRRTRSCTTSSSSLRRASSRTKCVVSAGSSRASRRRLKVCPSLYPPTRLRWACPCLAE